MTRTFLSLVLLAAPLAGCRSSDDADAYGTFQATETIVSAQAEGRLLAFDAHEGDSLNAGQAVGVVDTTQLTAQRDALVAQRRQILGQKRALLAQARATLAGRGVSTAGEAVADAGRRAALAQGAATLATVGEAEAALRGLDAQLATAREELARTERLYAARAATDRERNERHGQVAALEAQRDQARARVASIRAQANAADAQAAVQTAQGSVQSAQSTSQTAQAGVPEAQAAALDDQVAGIDAQIAGIDARLANATVRNPVAGTVLTVVAEPGEVVAPGSPLYTVGALGAMKLRAYATGNQLAHLRLGQRVEVRVDDGAGGLRTLPGEVVFVAANAQFTPTPIQTKDERATLVYAFDVKVNDPQGTVKIGMPGEVRFLPATR